MATSAAPRAKQTSERLFFTGMAAAMAVVAFAGFAPTYYLAGINPAPTPPLTDAIHIHAGLCTAWILLLLLQTGLIAANRRDLHKATGVMGIAIGIGVLLSGLYVAVHSERRVHNAATDGSFADPYVFLIFPVAAVTLFALFAGLGVWNRRRPDHHKRWMMLATASMIGPAFARIAMRIVPGVPTAITALVLIDIFVVALAVHDLRTRGRLHPTTLWGGGVLLVSEPVRVAIAFSEPWRDFARMLMG